MPKYPVLFPVIHHGKKYMPGRTVTMSAKLAEPLLENETLLPSDEEKTGPITEEAIVVAISQLDPMNGAQWTIDSVPQIPALEALLPGKITAKQRDAAFARYQKETK